MPLLRKPKAAKTQLQNDLIACFGSEHGQRVLLHLCREANITRFNPDVSHDGMLVDKGAQRIVWGIMTLLETDPKLLLETAKDNVKREYTSEIQE